MSTRNKERESAWQWLRENEVCGTLQDENRCADLIARYLSEKGWVFIESGRLPQSREWVSVCVEHDGKRHVAPAFGIAAEPAGVSQPPFREIAERIDKIIETSALLHMRVQLRILSDELKRNVAVAPVSGNGTEPPRPQDLFKREWSDDFSEDMWNGHQMCAFAESYHKIAGEAASHNGHQSITDGAEQSQK